MRRLLTLLLALLLLFCCAGCSFHQENVTKENETVSQEPTPSEEEAARAETEAQAQKEEAARLAAQAAAQKAAEEAAQQAALEEAQPDPYLVCIDAGHQAKGSSEKEPNGPGSSTMKARVTGGTRGTTTKLYEYELNLQVSLKLQAELEARGYEVVMVRTEHDVDISNVERSQVANDAEADAFIRIHANGSESSSAHGAMTICMTPDNPYNAQLYDLSRLLSDCVIDGLCEKTGAQNDGVWETDTMTGINWCETPVTIVEMGYMTNPEEDKLMASEDYQLKLAEGIADGIDAYFAHLEAEDSPSDTVTE